MVEFLTCYQNVFSNLSTQSESPGSSGSNFDSETLSLDSSFRETVVVNGRTYQQLALERGTTFTPCDDVWSEPITSQKSVINPDCPLQAERERLDRLHRILQLVFDHRLIFPPVESPQRILDCGYGSGAWALEVAEKYPECQVYGVDISPHMMPEEIPGNLWLQVKWSCSFHQFSANDVLIGVG